MLLFPVKLRYAKKYAKIADNNIICFSCIVVIKNT